MERHQFVAFVICLCVSAYVLLRDGPGDEAIARIIIVFVAFGLILFYRLVAFFGSVGFMEFFASDYGSNNSKGPYAFLFWLLFIIACLFQIFEWSLY